MHTIHNLLHCFMNNIENTSFNILILVLVINIITRKKNMSNFHPAAEPILEKL